MSRPNTGKKLRTRVIAAVIGSGSPMTLTDIESWMDSDAAVRGYPAPKSSQIMGVVAELKEAGILETIMPLLPEGMYVSCNRELQAAVWRYTRYQVPPLLRLAMLADEKGLTDL